MKTLVTLIFAAFLAGIPVRYALADSPSSMSSIRVTGTSTVTANPDRARVDVGVVTRAPESQIAVSQNASTFNEVMTSLRKTFGPNADIRALTYSLNPDYQYHSSGGQPTITGYTATNIVRVTIDDLSRIGEVIDTATKAGANRVPSVQFALRDEDSVRRQALREAAVKAKVDADALASALGLKVNRILAAEENGAVAVPLVGGMAYARTESSAAATSIQPGAIEVNANVTLTVEVSAR